MARGRDVQGGLPAQGRLGLALGCVENAVSGDRRAASSPHGGFSTQDWHHVAMISEFKTDYMALSKLAHLVRTGSVIHAFYNTIYGGLGGFSRMDGPGHRLQVASCCRCST